MDSSENSRSEEKGKKPFLSFLVLVGVILAIYYIVKKFIGVIPALIVSYLLYAHRDELIEEFNEWRK